MNCIDKNKNYDSLTHPFNLFVILTLAATPSGAVDSVSFEVGRSFSTHRVPTELARGGARWEWKKSWRISDHWSLGGYWEAAVGYWRTLDRLIDHEVTDFGLTPVFRLQRISRQFGVIPYVEFAIGAHLLSDKDISDRIRFSTSFQFADQVAVGLRFGARGQYDLSYCMQHLSNAGIDHPNPGINFNLLRFQYHF